jgi:outer membrane lipoprotein carrier protein
MLNVLRLLLPLFLVSLSTTLNAAPSNDPASTLALDQRDAKALAGLVEDLNRIKTIQGSFVQFAVDQRGVSIQESRGSFKAKRPDMFYWRTDAPLEQEIYSNARFVTVYDPDLEQATIQKNTRQGDHTPAVLFSGDTTRIGALYQVQETGEGGNVAQYVLTPRSKDSLFEKLRIRFEGTQLTEMRLRDSLGQETTIRFVYTEINLELDDALFQAKLPEGTDIIKDIPVNQNVE